MRKIPESSLWLGNVGDTWNPSKIFDEGILAVVDLAIDEQPARLPRELAYFRLPLLDGAGNPSWLLRQAVDIVSSLARSAIPTLVYCGAGMSRSPCVTAVALATVWDCSADEALERISKSTVIDISSGLWNEIRVRR